MIDTGTLLFSMAAAELDKLDTTVHLQLLCAADITSANAEFGEREHKYRWIQKGCEVLLCHTPDKMDTRCTGVVLQGGHGTIRTSSSPDKLSSMAAHMPSLNTYF